MATAAQTMAAARAQQTRGDARRLLRVGWVVALAGIVALGVGLRVQRVACCGDAPGWNDMVLTNGDLALNLLHQGRYVTTLTPRLHALAQEGAQVPAATLAAEQAGPALRPVAYYLPGYPLVLAALWAVTLHPDYQAAQMSQAVLDGLLGPLALALVLVAARRPRAGLVAALGYACAVPLVEWSARPLPDSLVTALVCAALAALVWRRALACGLVLGLACWLRGDMVLLPLFLGGALLLCRRRREAVRTLAGAALPLAALAGFYALTYGGLHLTRPGAGLLLWEGIGQQANPWGIAAPAGGNLDTAAGLLLARHHLAYGTWTGDSFLLHEALGHMLRHPAWFVGPTLARLWRVLSGPLDALALPPQLPPLALAVVALGWWELRRRAPVVAALVAALALSRLLPFTLLREEGRFVLALLPLYALCASVALSVGACSLCGCGRRLAAAGARWATRTRLSC